MELQECGGVELLARTLANSEDNLINDNAKNSLVHVTSLDTDIKHEDQFPEELFKTSNFEIVY